MGKVYQENLTIILTNLVRILWVHTVLYIYIVLPMLVRMLNHRYLVQHLKFKILKMSAVQFSKFRVCHVTSIAMLYPACYSASLCKISPKSDYRLLSYNQNDFQYCGRSSSWILKIIFGRVTAVGFQICCCISKFIIIRWYVVEIWPFNDFQDGGCPLSWILGVQEWVFE